METFSALLAICAGNSPVSGEFPHKGQWRGALMFSFICVWINSWVNNRKAGDFRRYRAHYDVTVMEDLDPVGSFEVPWASRGKWSSQCAFGAKGLSYGFRIMKIGPVVSMICPGQIGSHSTFYVACKISSNAPKKFQLSTVEKNLRNRRKLEFRPILALFGVKKGRKICHLGSMIYVHLICL